MDSKKKQPHIILITTDQQRYDSLSAHGSSFVHTPSMDRLAAEGISFSRAYCPNTVCTPSRASMMTGLHLSRHGAYNIGTTAVDHSIFLSQLLRGSGYRTHHIGKAHWYAWGTNNPETRPVDEAGTPFTDFVGFETAEVAIGHAGWGVSGHYKRWIEQKGIDPSKFKERFLFQKDANGTSDWELPTALHSGTWLVERAVHFLRGHDREQPFYLNLGFQDPHHPHTVPLDYPRRVKPSQVPLPPRREEQAPPEQVPLFHSGTINESRFRGRFAIAGNESAAWGDYFRDEHKTRLTRAYYYTMVQLIDDQLGILLDELDRLGYTEDTLVLFTSDHGEMLGDHHIGQKGPLVYEGVTHIPLLMRYPNGFKPCQVEDCVSLVDLLPTVLDFAGVDDPVRRDGCSLKAVLQGKERLGRSGVRIEYKEESDRIRYKAWVTPDWKLAVYPGELFGELYDLRNDPGETRNRYDDPELQGVKNRLLVAMLEDMERSEPMSERHSRV